MQANDFKILSQVYQIQGKVKNIPSSKSKVIRDKKVVGVEHQEGISAIVRIVLGLRSGKFSRGKI